MSIWLHLQITINRASTEHQHSIDQASPECQQRVNTASTECKQSVNDFRCCIVYNPKAVLWHLPIIEYWPPLWEIWSQSISLHLEMSVNRASIQGQRLWALHREKSKGYATAYTHSRSLAAFICNKDPVNVATTFNWASTERQRFLVM